MVLPSAHPSVNCDRPVPWKMGAAMTMVSSRGSGTRSRNWADCSGETLSRGAPFGVPVVPLVRMTVPPGRAGAGRSPAGCAAIRPSIVTAPDGTGSDSSTQVRMRGIAPGTAASSGRNSLSSSSAPTCSLATTSASCGPANPVFISTTRAPSLPAASSASTMPRWSRHSTATVLPAAMPAAASPRVSAFDSRSSSAKVRAPRSSMIAVVVPYRRVACRSTVTNGP